MVIINRTTGELTRTPEYYLMKHFSHFIQPGSHLLKTSDDGSTLAFRNQNGKTIIVCYNAEPQSVTKTFCVDGKALKATLTPSSLNTIVY